jgi:hypothetical protein
MASEIEISRKLIAARPRSVRENLICLVQRPDRMEVRPVGFGANVTIGCIPVGTNPATVTAPDQIRVPTRVPSIYFNYYEVWVPIRSSDRLLLERAYLHIHRRRDRDDQDVQLLALHTDPLLPDTAPSYIYKRGPHLHIGGANPNIDRAHIALCMNDPAQGGENLEMLTSTMAKCVAMIDQEVLPHYY